MANNLLNDWHNLTKSDLEAGGWSKIYDEKTQSVLWQHPNIKELYNFNGAKYTQSILQKRISESVD